MTGVANATVIARWLAIALCASAPIHAQNERTHTVSVRVVSQAADSVYLDHGRDIGLAVGDRVALFPPGSGAVDVVVRSLTHTSARCEAAPGIEPPPVGTLGEATVPIATTTSPTTPPGSTRPARPTGVPEHPPWTRAPEARDPDQPLMVPAYGQSPEQRAMRWSGRWFGMGQWNEDRSGDGDAAYMLLRSGLRADADNALGHAERIRFAGEWNLRDVSVGDRPGETDHTGRVDLFSVAFGDAADDPVGFEVGRFLSRHLPEIGLVDGVESVVRFGLDGDPRSAGGLRFGAGFGAYPRPFPARDSGDDVGVHAFVDYVADADRTFAAALGVQKTWHRGTPDRDLVVLRTEWRPWPRLQVLANAKVDFYTGSDTIESRSVELTELLVQLRWTAADGDLGAALVGSHFGWPELRRSEYRFLSPELVRDGGVDRASLSGFWRVADWCTLRARGDRFVDQLRDGTSARGDVDLRGVLGDGSALALSGFCSEGSYTSGPGASARLRYRLWDADVRLGYRWHRYSLDALVTGPERRVRESVSFGCLLPIGASGTLDLTAERWFGGGRDAFAFGAFVQWRF